MARKTKSKQGKKRQAVIVIAKKEDRPKKAKPQEGEEMEAHKEVTMLQGPCTTCQKADSVPCDHCAYPTQVFVCDEHAVTHQETVHGQCCAEGCEEPGVHMCRYCYDMTHGPAVFRCEEHMIQHINHMYRGPKCHSDGCNEWAACFQYIQWRMENLHANDIKRQGGVWGELMETQLGTLMDGCHKYHGYHRQPYALRLQLKWDPARFNELFGEKQRGLSASPPIVTLGV